MSIVQRTQQFVDSVWVESKKVAWPSRPELRESTTVVIIATFLVMIFLFVVDRSLSLGLGVFI